MTESVLGFAGIGLTMGLVFVPSVLGLMLALRCLDFPDLGIEASVALGVATAGVCIAAGHSFIVTAGAVVLTGMAAGTATSMLHVRFGVSKLLAGVIVLTASYSVALRIMGGPNVSLLGSSSLLDRVAEWPIGMLGSMPIGQIVFLSMLVGGLLTVTALFLRTIVGLRLRLVGANPVLAADLGVSRSVYLVGGVAAANALAALSGMLLAMLQGFSDASSGQGTLVMTVASLAIGEHLVIWLRRWGQVPALICAVMLGSVVYQTLIAVALRAGLPASDLKLGTAVLVTVVVALRKFDLGAQPALDRGY